MNLFLLFFVFAPAFCAVSPLALENCQAGSFFVENYIKYECFANDNVKGTKIVGCQPSNDLTGVTLGPWETHDERWFKYHCVIDGENAQYSVKACLDPVGEVLPVGKTRHFPEGESFTCFLDNNKVKLNHQTTIGCQVGTQVYGDRATWVDRRNDTISVGSENKVVGLGTTMQCKKLVNGSYAVEVAACLTSQNTYIRPEAYGTVDGEIVKCDLANGKCKLREAQTVEIGCSLNGKVYRHNEEWKSEDGTTEYACQFGKIEKKGCLVNNLLIPLHSVKYVDGTAYYCYEGTQLRSFGDLKGCPSASGEIVPFDTRIKNGEKMDSCGFTFDKSGAVIFVWNQVGCIYSKEMITINAIQKFGEQYVHCALNGTNGYLVKLMTKVEVEQWLTATKQQWSNVVSGHEGEGKSVKREVPTTTTTTTTTVPPTTTTTTTVPPTTTTTTTTTPIPTTVPTTTTTTTRTTPKPVIKCVDLIEDCENLQYYCHSEHEHAQFIKEAIQKFSINPKKKSKMLQYLSHVLSDENDETTGEDKKQKSEKNCCCGSENGGKKSKTGRCLCEDQKLFNQQIVRSLCPKTCEICEEIRRPISSIIAEKTSPLCTKEKCYQ